MDRSRLLLALLILTAIMGAIFLIFSNKKNTLNFSADQNTSLLDERSEYSPPSAGSLTSRDTTAPSESTFLQILPSDCQNECASFSLEKERERYCRNVCGLTVENNGTVSNTPYQESLERKDAAIKNKDLDACSGITDANLRKSCEVRVTEDLLE